MSLSREDQKKILDFTGMLTTPKIKHHTTLENSTKTQYVRALVLDVEDEASLKTLIEKIYAMNLHRDATTRISFHVAAGGRTDISPSDSNSFTECAQADVIIRLVGKEFRKIKITNDSHVLKVGASVQQYELDKIAFEKYQLTMSTSTLIGSVTVGGISGTNGTGRDQPGIPSLIKSMRIMLPNGEIITLDETHKHFKTLTGAHLGALGIILDVDIQCIDAKKLHRKCIPMTIPGFNKAVKDGLFKKEEYVGVMQIPFGEQGEWTDTIDKSIIVRTFTPVPLDTPDKNNLTTLSNIGQALEVGINEEFEIMGLIKQFPHLLPYFNKYLIAKVEIGESVTESIGPWFDMYHYQTNFPTGFVDNGRIIEVSDDFHEFLAFQYHYVKTLEKYAKNKKFPQAYPAYFRYLQGTNGGLSPTAHAEGKHVIAIDIPSIPGFPDYEQFKKELDNNFFFANLNGKKVYDEQGHEVKIISRVHPGKDFDVPHEYLSKMYDLKKFKQALTDWYKEHDLDVETCPLINNFIQNIFTPKPRKLNFEALHKTFAAAPAMNFDEIAQKVMKKIDNSEHGLCLKRKLQSICAPKVSDKGPIPLFPAPVPTQPEKQATCADQKWCSIL